MRSIRNGYTARALAALLLAGCAIAAVAQPYPSRMISVVVPFSPGGVSDITARPLATAMAANLGQSIIIENKPGAGGGVGMAYAAKAKPDGYTLMMALPSISIIPAAEKLAGKPPSFIENQFIPIARLTADPTLFAVRADAPWKTLDDFVQDARRNPGSISYSSSGVYGTTHAAMEMFAHAAKLKLLHAPYSGGGQQVTALLGGHVQATPQTLAPLAAHIKSGKMRVLAVWSGERLKSMPEVPTLKELGYDAEFYLWTGLFAPPGTPPDIVARLRASVKEAVADAGFRKAIAALDTPIQYQDAPEFKKFWDEDSRRLTEVVNHMGRLE
jgi:tripartite-type tricarboxylate transporter receptor subunit TctC